MKNNSGKIMLTRAFCIIICICVGTAFSFSVAAEDVSAASKPAKVKTLSAKAVSCSNVSLSWSKAKRASGYQVVRNGVEVCKTASRSYTNSGLKGSTSYSYKVRAYKTYKQKQYFNKKTGKWQTKRPKKKYRGGTRKVTKYRYGSYSPARTIKTPAAPTPAPVPKEPEIPTPEIPGEKDTDETHAEAAEVTVDIPKEANASAPALQNADDPEKIRPTSAKATAPAIGITDIQDFNVKATSRNVQLSWTAQTSATGYQVFRADKETDTPQLIFSSKDSKYCDIEGMTAGKTYYYQVRAFQNVNNATYYGNKTEKKSVTVPASSADGEHIFITDTGITLSWDAPQLTTAQKEEAILADLNKEYPEIEGTWTVTSCQYSYPVSRDGSLKATVTDTSWVDRNVVDGNTYSYKIKKSLKYKAEAFDAVAGENISKSGDILLSSETYDNVYFEKGAEGFNNTEVENGLIKLAPPTGFSAIGNFDNVALSWDVNEEAAGYKIYRDGSPVKTIDKKSTCSYKDEGLVPQTQYTYTIKSVNERGGVSATAASLSIRTPARPSFLPPAGFTAKATYNSVDLKWTANTAVDSYKIYRNDVLIATMKADEAEYIDGGNAIHAETKYTYAISSVKGTDESVKSALTITTPKSPALLPPEKFKGTGNYDNVALSWTINEAADSYNIYRNDVKVANVPGAQAGYVDTGLTPRTIYTYSVTSVVDDKESVKATFRIATPAKPDMPFDELKNVTLSYGDATIHLGQKWTSTLKSQLAAGSSGTDFAQRVNYVYKSVIDPKTSMITGEYTFNEDIYMFDTGDYDNFLAVYVAGDQIIQWTTNMQDMGSENGTVMKQGAVALPAHGQATMKNRLSSGSEWYNGIDYNGVFIGGFQVETIMSKKNGWSRNIESEKRVGLHFMNAYRHLLGSKPLAYSDALDGKNNTCSKTYTTPGEKDYVNSRYGAQPFAETCSLSKQCIHNTILCKEGPLAGQGSGTRHDIIRLATGEIVFGENIGSGALGESCIAVYADSVLHLQAIYNPDFTKVGIGFGDMSYALHAELFAK